MITVDEHRRRILETVAMLPAETLPLSAAHGRALAEDVRSRWPIPLFDASAMDGYAVRIDDAVAGAVLRVVADIPAGSAADPPLAPGEAARIMTGAPVPSDADAVVPLEQTDLGAAVRQESPAQITVLVDAVAGAHIRRRGEDRGPGEIAVAAGAQLGSWQLSAVASAGFDAVRAVRPPRVAVISTGSELVLPSSTPSRGQIPESNSVLLDAAVAEAGCVLVSARSVPDDPGALRAAVDEALSDADAVILTGGASVGAFDVVKAVLGAEYGIRFDEVAVQPGKPQGFGVDDGRLVFCLPGSPVGMAISFEMFVRPALRAMSGFSEIDRRRLTISSGAAWRVREGRMQIVPIVVDGDRVRPASGEGGRHPLSSLATAQGLAIIPADMAAVEVGDPLSVMLW